MRTQTEIPGIERESIPELDEAIREWAIAREQKAIGTKREKEAAAIVQARLAEHGLESYEWIDGARRSVVARETTEKARFIEVSKGNRDDDDGAVDLSAGQARAVIAAARKAGYEVTVSVGGDGGEELL